MAGVLVGQFLMFLVVAVLGAIASLPIGYAYVGLVMLLREELGPPPSESSPV